jgi:hypothetical protein
MDSYLVTRRHIDLLRVTSMSCRPCSGRSVMS